MNKKYTPKHAKRWEYPEHYFGDDHSDFYRAMVRHRDSDILSESNFESTLARLGGESKTVIIARSGHWAVGWVEELLVHKSNSKALKELDKILVEVSGYPVLDENDFWEREQEKMQADIKYYSDYFCENILKFVGLKEAPKGHKKSLKEFAAALYETSCGYSGLDDATVSHTNVLKLVQELGLCGPTRESVDSFWLKLVENRKVA